MATRKAIKEDFIASINAVLDTYDAHITTEYPNSEEAYPAVVYSYSDREVPMNNRSAPTNTEQLEDGTVLETYSTVMEGVFSIEIVDSDELRREDVYGAIREHFESFAHPINDESEVNADAYRITVSDSTPTNFEDRTPRGRGDAMDISVFHTRQQTQKLDPMDTINQTTDEQRTIE
jgi:hypothetical protein